MKVEKEKAMSYDYVSRRQMTWEKWLALGPAPAEREAGAVKEMWIWRPGQKAVFVWVEEGVVQSGLTYTVSFMFRSSYGI